MKAKTIKAVIRKKVDEWIATIDDKEVAEIAKKNTLVTGGAIVSMLLGEQVNDFDIYFRTKEATKRIAAYYLAKFALNPPPRFRDGEEMVGIHLVEEAERVWIKVQSAGIASEAPASNYQYFETQPDEAGVQYVEEQFQAIEDANEESPDGALDESKPAYRPVFLSENAITLSNRVQLVIRFFGEVEEIHKNYDFVHCTCVWSSWDGNLVLPAAALESMLTKELRYVGSLYPLCSIIRLRKFIARGWHVNAGQILKMCMQLNGMDLRDIRVLRDQLTGVDAHYFRQILERLENKAKAEGTEDQPIDTCYLVAIIDRMF